MQFATLLYIFVLYLGEKQQNRLSYENKINRVQHFFISLY
jgi:hypothetical protein